MAALGDALKLHRLGWRVVAAPLGAKAPMGPWKSAQSEPATGDSVSREFGDAERNIFIVTGSISRLAVLDCDDVQALEYWRDRLGSVLDETACASTGRGKHFYFSLPEREDRKGRSSPGGESGAWDLRANGGGVIAPPSRHPSGRCYEWVDGRGPDHVKPAPPALWAPESQSELADERVVTVKLAELLANVPQEGNRNNWLAQVAGHFAVQISYQDAYEATVRAVAEPLGLEPEEIEKLIKSIWSAEHAKRGGEAPTERLLVVTAAQFAGVEEPGAEPMVGEGDEVLIPCGGDVMIYGDGGAGKTTLTTDLAFHVAAAEPWLGFGVPRPARVLLIEAEGPRPLFRRKIGRKLTGWAGGDVGDRVRVLERPWAAFTFASVSWRAKLSATLLEEEIDLLIVGPLTRVGMDSAGTLPEISAFMALVAEVRKRSQRPLTVILVHHENKGGTVSGAWEGAGDTLIHVEARGNGKTRVTFQKARWSSEAHGTSIDLAWAAGEGFRVTEGREGRDLVAEIQTLLTRKPWLTSKEVAAPADKGGVGANTDTVKELLKERSDLFASRKGPELGRAANAVLWGLAQAAESVESADGSLGTEAATDSRTRPKDESVSSEVVPAGSASGFASPGQQELDAEAGTCPPAGPTPLGSSADQTEEGLG
jgi:hypothetical protein